MWRYSPYRRIPVSSQNFNVKLATNLDILPVRVSRKSKLPPKPGDPKHMSYKKTQYIQKKVEEDSTSEDSFCLQVKIKCILDKEQEVPRPKHLITNLAYRLKPHHTRNLYLRARLDTCVDVNLMPASVYKLVFNDSKMQKLAASN